MSKIFAQWERDRPGRPGPPNRPEPPGPQDRPSPRDQPRPPARREGPGTGPDRVPVPAIDPPDPWPRR